MCQLKTLKQAKKIIYWDPYHDHVAKERFDNVPDFMRCLSGHLKRGTGFSIALSVDKPPELLCIDLEKFCDIAWQIADGNKIVYVVIEEVADAFDTTGKAKGRSGQIFRAGRSFGLIIFATTQSVSEIPKTLVKQCGTKVVFYHNDYSDIPRAAQLAGHRPDDITALQVGQYYIRSNRMLSGELKRTRKL